MAPVAVVIIIAVLEYVAFGWLVGRARHRYGVKAPATTGHEVFERYFRVQQNTLETLIVFIPAISLFAIYVNPNWAAWIGLVYVVGRILYLRAYVADPAKRSAGFTLSALPILVLLVGALLGAARAMIESNPAG
ncbi:MAG TPA: MAPEG family protein [Steroidobacteraceae bacterium]